MNSISRAILYGDPTMVSAEQFLVFSRLGLSHLLSVSGFHIFVILYFLHIPLKYFEGSSYVSLRRAKLIYLCLSFLLLLGLVSASRWQIPAIKSLILTIFALLSFSFGISINKKLAVIGAFFLALLFGNGSFLSFFLSLSAYLALFLARNNIFSISLWIWLGTNLPSAFIFHRISVFSPLANIIFGNLISVFVLIPSLFAQLLYCLHFPSNKTIFLFTDKAFELLWPTLKQWSAIEYACLNISNAKILIATGTMLLWVLWKRRKFLPSLFIVVVLTTILVFSSQYSLYFLDVGQGDAILLTGEKALLVDAGPGKLKYPYPAASVAQLDTLGINQLENILLTHPDWDHYGGLESILLNKQVKSILLGTNQQFIDKSLSILETAERFEVPIQYFEDGAFITRDMRCWLNHQKTSINDLSPLCQIKKGETKILLTGDMSQKNELYFVQKWGSQIQSDIIKIGHHGSATSSNPIFLNKVNPNAAIISVGAKNRYHHPTEEVLRRLENENIKIFRTDLQGNVSF